MNETYIKVVGTWTYRYRAVNSAGDTIDFMPFPRRDLSAARLFLRLAYREPEAAGQGSINVDGHSTYARTIAELKKSGELGRRCRCRPSPYLNNIIEQEHLIRKGQIRWLPKGDVIGQRQFIHTLFGVDAIPESSTCHH